MRRTIIATKQGRAAAVSDYPLEPHERGVTPAWKADGHPGIANGFNLHNDLEVPVDGVRVRLPRRLCARTVPADEAMRWIRGQHPSNWDTWHWEHGQPIEALNRNMPFWERRYPSRGLGFPKRLPRSRRAIYAPVLNIHANGDILLDDQHVATARRVEAEFHREVIREHDIGQVVQTFRPGAITAKVTIELETSTANYEAFRTVATARHNGSPNLRATAKGGAGYAGTITRYTYEPGPRFATVTLDLVMVTITTSTVQTG